MVVIGSNFSRYFIYFLLSYFTLTELNNFVFHQNTILIKTPAINYFLKYLFVSIITIFFFYNLNLLKNLNKIKIFLIFYFIYFFYTIIFSLLDYDINYWDYKFIAINYVPFLFFITTIIFGLQIDCLKIVTKFYIKIIFPLSFILFILFNDFYPELFSRILIPISFFLIFFNFFKNYQKIFILILSFMILLFDQSHRLNLLNIIISYFLLFFFYFRINSKTIYLLIFYSLILSPIFFLYLSINYNFDIFFYLKNKFLYNFIADYNPDIIENTRSLLYYEVYNSLNGFYDFIFGKGASASYKSNVFQHTIIISEGRFESEVGFLNIILKSGIIGFIIFSFIFLYPSYLGIKFSKNVISKILSIKLISYWFLLFVEYFQWVNLNYFFIFFLSGLLLSEKFRNFDENKIKSLLT